MIDTLVEFLHVTNLISFFIKLFGMTLSVLYVFFSIIIIRQVSVMRRTIQINDRGLLTTATYFQLGVSLILAFYSILIL